MADFALLMVKTNYYMKKMTITGLLTTVLLISGLAVFGQEDSHQKLDEHHKKGKEHANAIVSGESKTKEEHKMHAAEAGKSLTEAKKHHAKLKADDKGANGESHKAIEKHHADAQTHLNSLNSELNKSNPDEKKVKEHAKNHHDAIDKAQKEHQKIKKS